MGFADKLMFWKKDSIPKDIDFGVNPESPPPMNPQGFSSPDPFGQFNNSPNSQNPDPFAQNNPQFEQSQFAPQFGTQPNQYQQQTAPPEQFPQQFEMSNDPFNSQGTPDPFGSAPAPFQQASPQNDPFAQKPAQGQYATGSPFPRSEPKPDQFRERHETFRSGSQVHDSDLILSKLDTLRAMLDSVNQRLSIIEDSMRKDKQKW